MPRLGLVMLFTLLWSQELLSMSYCACIVRVTIEKHAKFNSDTSTI